ncbi:MAG: protein-tyrosine-phosphatase [Acidobacteria bacterium SCN 69-37]|nr:MAG: protein-tyrosine-phosphatase [Acidobacteria bacterium SCN 69-37]
MKPRVLFLCTGNSCRSQIAEGLLRHMAGDRFDVLSAGTEPVPVSEDAIDTMAEVGIDISGHESKAVRPFLGQHFGYVITVCDRAVERCPIFPGAVKRLEWNFADPAVVSDGPARKRAFREVRDQIAERIREFVSSTP